MINRWLQYLSVVYQTMDLTLPLSDYIELRTTENSSKGRNHWRVWSSQVHQPPIIKWVDHNNIEIKQISYTVLDYEPTVKLNDKTYGVHLNVLPTKP